MRLAKTVLTRLIASTDFPFSVEAIYFAMNEHLLELKIVQPGRPIGQYHAVDSDTLRLEKIVYPDRTLPFDVGILPTALTDFDEPWVALVLGGSSHPVDTEIESRLLGALQRNEDVPILLAVPAADERAPSCVDELNVEQRSEIIDVLRQTYPGEWIWRTVEEVEPRLHTATIRYRQKADRSNHRIIDPAWKPLHIGRPEPSFAEAECYTPAEYTFFELPYRFQHYVNEYLAPDERILYAARRPAMRSEHKRSWLRREQLQEGVLILTSQRLIQLAELVPPDSANIRYGFHTSVGVVERLAGISVSTLGIQSLFLSTTWNARDGKTSIGWEIPASGRTSLDELATLLEKFIADDPNACQLRRGARPNPPDKLPLLSDTSSSNPESLLQLNGQFSTTLGKSLIPGESAYAWALLPEWMDRKKGDRVLVVTDHRIFLLPGYAIDVPLVQIATLEYTGSILESWLAINFIENGKLRREVIFFPYPAQDSFRTCFEAARRRMAVVPLT